MPAAVLSVCATGEGTGKIAKSVAENILLANGMRETALFTLSIGSIATASPEYKKIIENYRVAAVIGSIDPELGIPVFSIRNILTPAGQEDFLRALKRPAGEATSPGAPKTLAMSAEALLSDHILYLNIKRALVYVSEFIGSLEAGGLRMSDDVILKLMLHTCCMLERNVQRHCVAFDKKEEYIENNERIYEMLRESTTVLEKRFKTQISDDEICYMINIVERLVLGEKED
jgi:transcriptional regulatory protein LevR